MGLLGLSSVIGVTVTYVPTNRLYFERAVIDAFRILIPSYTATVLGVAGIMALILLHRTYGVWRMLAATPALAFLTAVIAHPGPAGLKWAITGRVRPGSLS